MSEAVLVQKINLYGTVSQKFALDWSPDNKIAICSDHCIYILTSRVSPLESCYPLPLHQKVIKLPNEPLNFKLLKNLLPVKEGTFLPEYIYSAVLDRTLTPDCDGKSAFLLFQSAKWSAKGANKTGSCYLATLTMDHRLVIYDEKDDEWEPIMDVSNLLYELHQAIWNEENGNLSDTYSPDSFISTRSDLYNEKTSEAEIAKQKIRLYNLAATGMVWTNVFGTTSSLSDSSYKWSYLIVAMKSGIVVWWKISPDEGEIVSLAYEWDTGFGLITFLCWQQLSQNSGFLCCGMLNGQLAFARVNIEAEGREPKLSLKSTHFILSEPDSIRVDNISVLKTSVQKYVIICNKQYLLFMAEVCITGSEICIKNMGYTEELGNLPVTGCSVLDPGIPQSQVIFSSIAGNIIKTKISFGSEGPVINYEPLEINADLEHNMIQGLGTSPSGLLCAVILNTSSYYNHLIKKEALQLLVFLTKPYNKIFSEFEQILKPQFPFLQAPTNTICRHIDYFECARVSLASESALPPLFASVLDFDKTLYESLSPNQMFFTRFLLLSLISGSAEASNSLKPEELDAYKDKLISIETVILAKYIQTVLSSCQEKLDLLSPAQVQSLLLMADWLYIQYNTPISFLYEAFGQDCPSEIEAIPPRETCRICKLPVKLDDFKRGSCENKHEFSRCCLSLLMCDTLPYSKCISCNSLALQDVWAHKLTCTYCSLPLV